MWKNALELKEGEKFKDCGTLMKVVSESGSDGLYIGMQKIIHKNRPKTMLAVDVHRKYNLHQYIRDEMVEVVS